MQRTCQSSEEQKKLINTLNVLSSVLGRNQHKVLMLILIYYLAPNIPSGAKAIQINKNIIYLLNHKNQGKHNYNLNLVWFNKIQKKIEQSLEKNTSTVWWACIMGMYIHYCVTMYYSVGNGLWMRLIYIYIYIYMYLKVLKHKFIKIIIYFF